MADGGEANNHSDGANPPLEPTPTLANHANNPDEQETARRHNEQVERNREKFIYGPIRCFFEKSNRYGHGITAIATTIIACLTLSIACDSNRQAESIKGELGSMSDQIEITKIQLRPHLKFGINVLPDRVDGKVIAFYITPTWDNSAATEAVNVTTWDSWQYFPGSVPDTKDFSKPYGGVTPNMTSTTISNGSPVLQPSLRISSEYIEDARLGRGIIIIWGHIEYSDIFRDMVTYTIDWSNITQPTIISGETTISFPIYLSKCNRRTQTGQDEKN